jgi:hypothetical protein
MRARKHITEWRISVTKKQKGTTNVWSCSRLMSPFWYSHYKVEGDHDTLRFRLEAVNLNMHCYVDTKNHQDKQQWFDPHTSRTQGRCADYSLLYLWPSKGYSELYNTMARPVICVRSLNSNLSSWNMLNEFSSRNYTFWL